MFKNKKVVLSSVAIIFTLIVSAVFVNFTLANSGTPVNENNAELSAATGLVGYSNIDLAVINSNSASLKANIVLFRSFQSLNQMTILRKQIQI